MKRHLADIVTHHLDRLWPDSKLSEAAARMAEMRISSMLVMEGGSLAGIVTERDIVRAMSAGMALDTPVARLMSTQVLTIGHDVELAAAFRFAVRHGIRHLVVLDEHGQPLGVVSESDFRFHLGIGFFAHLSDVASLMGQNWIQGTTDSPLSGVLEQMVETRSSCVIVTRQDAPVGLVTERDVVRLFGEGKQAALLGEVMSSPVHTIRSNAALTQAAAQMQILKIRHLIVVDEQDRLVGLLSEHDLIHPLEWMDEEFGRVATETQDRLRQLMNTIPDLVYFKDLDGHYLDCNEAFSHCIGVARDAVIGRTDSEFMSAGQAESHRLRDAEVIAAGKTLRSEGWVTQHDGQRILMEFSKSPVMDPGGACVGVVSVARDISERKLAEKQLRLAASVFQFAHDGIYITDGDAFILEINRAFEEITGYHRADVVGKKPDILASGKHPPEFFAEMWDTLRREGYWSGEVWNRRKDGELLAVLTTISAVHGEAGGVTHYVCVFTDITALKLNQRQVERLAYYDALTQLPNRSLFTDRFRIALAQAERSGELLAVGYLDLDDFKPVNDSHGHPVGDKLLQEVGQRIDRCLRSGDTASRIGGDEFALLVTGLRSMAEAEQAMARLLAALAEPYLIEGLSLSITASLGYTLFPYDDGDGDALLRHADQAMYAAKQGGRNRYVCFDPEHDRRTVEQKELLRQVENGLAAGEFQLYYQPKVDMRQGTVVGVEALIRWHHPELGLLLPHDFLPLTENLDIAVDIGNWVLKEALNQALAWRKAGLALPVSVNISPRHLQDVDFVPHLSALFEQHPELDAGCLELEILESTAFEDVALVSEVIRECAALGVTFALDDFGTGYSTLIYLRHLHARVLKVDQTFVRDMTHDMESFAIVESVIGLAAAFKRQLVAEGVETAEQGKMLLQLGCNVAQGFGIAEPMPAGQIAEWIERWRPDPLWRQV
ncbi:EAL domain-containing protein [Ferriphaselus sp. R-1]|uniref:EAL domain-containing protein n=1 Tax=Ferriphaselus sp. R-1 TaxID=1485544 RepID=UPI00068C4AB8|nr:EAL domain-containing protein [Ferriphaselus sp. R-1]